MPRDYNKLLKEVEQSLTYWQTIPLVDFSRSLDRLLRAQGVSRSALARKIGTSRAYITKVLSGDENLTVAAMAKLAMAVDGVVRVRVEHATESPEAAVVTEDQRLEARVEITMSAIRTEGYGAVAGPGFTTRRARPMQVEMFQESPSLP